MADYNEIETKQPFCHCTECSSPIEILFIDNNNIEFQCCNKKGNHKIKMLIEDYINKMKNQNFDIMKDKCFNNNHYKTFESFCFECKMNLCEECLKSREHLNHDKISIKEILPKNNELKLVEKIIKDCELKDELNNLKNLIEMMYDTYKEYSNNYYYAMNIHHILIYFTNNNQYIKNNLEKEDYENIMKISKRGNKIMKRKIKYN